MSRFGDDDCNSSQVCCPKDKIKSSTANTDCVCVYRWLCKDTGAQKKDTCKSLQVCCPKDQLAKPDNDKPNPAPGPKPEKCVCTFNWLCEAKETGSGPRYDLDILK